MAKIYEVRDTTNDEMYYPIGFFTDLDLLIHDIMGCKDPTDIMSGFNEYDWGASLEIVEHEADKWDEGRTIRKFHWAVDYDEEIGDYKWGKATLVDNRPPQRPPRKKDCFTKLEQINRRNKYGS